jgi:predicted dehydrogenase
MQVKNILLIGLGNIGQIHLRNLKKFKNLNIYVFDKDPNKITSYISEGVELGSSDKDFWLEKQIDGAIVATPTKHHFDISINLIEANIPHLIEKPVVKSKENFEKIFETAKSKNIFVMAGFVERFHGCVSYLKQEIQKQNLIFFSSSRYSVKPDGTRELDNVLFDILIHDLDIFNYLQDNSLIDSNKIQIMQNEEFVTANYLKDSVFANFSANRSSQKKTRSLKIVTDSFEYDVDLIDSTVTKTEFKSIRNIDNLSKPFIEINETTVNIDPSESIYNEQYYFLNNAKKGFDKDLYKSYQFSHYACFNFETKD